MAKQNYTVAFFLEDLAYGGPEEGGWYYRCGYPVDELSRFTRGFRNEDDAYAYCRKLNDRVAKVLNKDRRSMDSVLSEGEYWANVCEGTPKAYPETRPHYE